jgi:ABC-type sugar transport system ATPase subunit
MCTRVVVLRDGRVATALGADGLTEHALVRAMEGDEDGRSGPEGA